jgi:two-component system sensor histidine kinase/response regulator
MSIEQSIRVLFVEDREEDAELAAWTMRRGGLDITCERVCAEGEYVAALTGFQPDVIVSDYSMPHFDGMRALHIWLERGAHLPFLILTGSMNEETAVACLKAGATDYVLKEQMSRLPFAVKEALAKYQTLTQKQAAEEALRESERVYRLLADNTSDTIWLYDLSAERFTYVSPSLTRLLGYSVDTFAQKGLSDVVSPKDYARLTEETSARLAALYAGDETKRVQTIELNQTRKDGSSVLTEVVTSLIADPDGRVTQMRGTTRDITERKLAERSVADALGFNSAIVENSTMGLITYRATGECISANEAAARMVGGTVEQLKRQNFHQVESWKTSGHSDRRRSADGGRDHDQLRRRCFVARETLFVSARR